MAHRIAVLGGTFDPFHLGHLQIALDAAVTLQLDQVLIVPAGDPWQKPGQVIASADDRYAMALLGTIEQDHVDVSRIEIDREGPTFTSDTLRQMREMPEYAEAELYFLLGADAVGGLRTWHEFPTVLELATFVGVTRPGQSMPSEQLLEGVAVRKIQIAAVDVSSTMIRERVATGKSLDGLTTPTIAKYICKRGLYGSGLA